MFWDNDLWIMVFWVDLWRRANILDGGWAKFYFLWIQLELYTNIFTPGVLFWLRPWLQFLFLLNERSIIQKKNIDLQSFFLFGRKTFNNYIHRYTKKNSMLQKETLESNCFSSLKNFFCLFCKKNLLFLFYTIAFTKHLYQFIYSKHLFQYHCYYKALTSVYLF